MPDATVNGITIHHDIQGPEDGTPVLLISGVGTQMTRYPQAFVDILTKRGYRVIRMDNRDIGLSQKFTDAGLPDFKKAAASKAAGEAADLPYQLSDMAADAAALLEHLGIGKAHVVGSSMGGMVVQLLAIEHPAKVASLTSIMSNTGNPALSAGTPEARGALTAPRPDPEEDRDGFIAHGVRVAQIIGSPAWPQPEELIRASVEADLDRSWHPTGFARQYAAILGAPDRRERLKSLSVPTLVIHGVQDPLVPVDGGRDTAQNVPGAEILEIDGMGHNMPPEIFTQVADAIDGVVARA